ncbi:MAG TPA: beta galactosidase jelly roll domain-containing protein, partial [Pelobium sp.]|nr:beta galactosidase jelly roll domain-containing protein [Pelobium sp.]
MIDIAQSIMDEHPIKLRVKVLWYRKQNLQYNNYNMNNNFKRRSEISKAKLRLVLLSAFVGMAFQASAQQYKLNYGLSQPQDANTLPKSAVPVVAPQKKAKVAPKTILVSLKDNIYNIKGGWELQAEKEIYASGEYISSANLDTKQWYNATVPGTVLTTLVDQGVYPDPYFGLNNLAIPDNLCRQNWWYRTSFETPKDNPANKKAWLMFNGINYQADVWLNGHLLGKISGAFKRGKFDISEYLNPKGVNTIAVRIIPPQNPGIPHEESPSAGRGPNGGLLTTDGPTFISSEGWDWIPGIRDRNIGIWQDVKLQFTGDVNIIDPQVITDLPLPDTTKANITVKTEIRNNANKAQTVTVKGEIEGISFTNNYQLKANEAKQIEFNPTQFAQLKFK